MVVIGRATMRGVGNAGADRGIDTHNPTPMHGGSLERVEGPEVIVPALALAPALNAFPLQSSLIELGLEITEPRLNFAKAVRFGTVRAIQFSVVVQMRKGPFVEVYDRIDLDRGCGADEFQRRHGGVDTPRDR